MYNTYDANDEKGEEGEGTGAAARKAIRAKEKQGLTQEQIGKIARRSASVIGAILSGEIANPPSEVARRLNAS